MPNGKTVHWHEQMVKGDSGRAQKEIQRAVEKATIFLEDT